MKTKGINHLALVCRDMAETVKFYTEALGPSSRSSRTYWSTPIAASPSTAAPSASSTTAMTPWSRWRPWTISAPAISWISAGGVEALPDAGWRLPAGWFNLEKHGS